MRICFVPLLLLAACTPPSSQPAAEPSAAQCAHPETLSAAEAARCAAQGGALTAPTDAADFQWGGTWWGPMDPPPQHANFAAQRISTQETEVWMRCAAIDQPFIIERTVALGASDGPLTIITSTRTFTFDAVADNDSDVSAILTVSLAPGTPERAAFIEALIEPQAAITFEAAGVREVMPWSDQIVMARYCL